MKRSFTFAFLILLTLTACGPKPDALPEQDPTVAALITVSSPAFADGETIPVEYTCDGENVSPPLEWSDPPEGTQSFALIMDDPDAPIGTYVHWVAYNIPADVLSLPRAVPEGEILPDGGLHGRNAGNQQGYTGPCPPSGTHRYFFKLYALDTVLEDEPGLRKQDLLDAVEGHLLAYGELIGTYSR